MPGSYVQTAAFVVGVANRWVVVGSVSPALWGLDLSCGPFLGRPEVGESLL